MNIFIGNLRATYVGNLRLEAFRKVYGREPVWLAERPRVKDGKALDDDFILASRLVDVDQAYKDFDELIRDQLDSLREDDYNSKNRKMIDE